MNFPCWVHNFWFIVINSTIFLHSTLSLFRLNKSKKKGFVFDSKPRLAYANRLIRTSAWPHHTGSIV
jgi:hypothetical protein